MTLAEIEAREQAATPGPWHAPGMGEVHSDHDGHVYVRVYPVGHPHEGSDEEIVADGCAEHDADFIAHARTDVPTLIRWVRVLLPLASHGTFCFHPLSPCTCGLSEVSEEIGA